jgi:multidrug efflux pump subunit AcrB
LLRPTFGLLLTLLLAIGGAMAAFTLVKESLPDLEIPQATITTFWAGADPQTIEQEITEPIEREIKTLKGLKSITSASFDSYSIIAVEFEADAELLDAMQRLRAKVDDAESELPTEAEAPSINQVSVDDRPVVTVVLFGDADARTFNRVADDLENRFEQIQGVNEVEFGGRREEVVHIQMLPDRMLALDITPTQIRDAVRAANVDSPWGEIESEQIGATVRLQGRFRDIEDLRELPVTRIGAMDTGRTVRLGELARVQRDLEAEETRALFSWEGSDFRPSIEISVKKVPGSDTIAVIDRVLASLQEAEASQAWPPGMRYRVTQNESEQIADSLVGVVNNAWQAMLAVFVILFLLLTWREGLIAGLCVPLTFLGALIVVQAIGFTLNELVIIGMVLALGLLVDVFILMMEGMHEAIFVEHESFSDAAMKTIRRYALPAAAGTATTILALAPLMAIGGVAGKFIRVLPATAIACLAVAFIIAVSVAIPLSRYFLGSVTKKEERTTPVDRMTASVAGWLRRLSLAVTLRNRWVAGGWTLGAGLVFAASVLAFSTVPVVMYPKSDGLKLGINIEHPPTTTLETSQQVADRVGDLLLDKEYLESVVQLVGKKSPFAVVGLGDALNPTVSENFVGFSAIFVPRDDRAFDGYVYADQLRREINILLGDNYAGASAVVVPETGQPSNDSPVQIELIGDDMDRLRAISLQVQGELQSIAGAVDVRDNVGSIAAEIKLTPRREAVDFYGLSLDDLAAQVRYAMAVSEIGKFDVGGLEDDLPIKLSTAWPSRAGGIGGPTRLEELAMVRAFTPDNGTVPLLSLLSPSTTMSPTSITHEDGQRALSVLAKTDGRPPTEIIEELTPKLDDMRKGWPAGYTYRVAGEAQETAETFASAGSMLIIAIVLIFGLLVLLFDSFAQSLIIIATMPLALIGTFLGFYVFQIPFSFFAMVGLISLIGIVVNDTIVMVDTMNTHLRGGVDVRTAAARGAADRLRPILSTSLTTIVGLVPLAVSNPMWRPLCYAIIFGLLVSTITALFIVPCMYLLFTRPSAAAATASSE